MIPMISLSRPSFQVFTSGNSWFKNLVSDLFSMSVSETGYDPIQVEEAIDDAYRFAEEVDLGEYQEPLEEAIQKVESLPYAVNREGTYTEEEMTETIRGLNMIENLQRKIMNETLDKEMVVELRELEDYLEEKAFRPARDHGALEN